MPLQADGPAPYGPPAPLLLVVNRFRERGLQTPFTADVLARAGVKESLARRTIQTMIQLDLIELDGNPTPAFREYAKAPAAEAETRWREIVKSAYQPVFDFADPEKDSRDRIRDAFRGYEPKSQQDRMITLFIGLCGYGGMKVPDDPPKKPAVHRSTRPASPESRRRGSGKSSPDPVTPDGQVVQVKAALPDALDGLVRQLAAEGPTWTKARRDAFISIWEAVVDFTYPVQQPGNGGPAQGSSA